jgi:hypothetical protein
MKQTILRFTALGLLMAASLAVFLDRSHASVARGANTETTSAAPQGKTAGQAYKNIKVLQDLPEGQLLPVMNFFTASLGVRCNFCHVVKDGNLVLELDDKPEKNTAREMIRMVVDVNKGTFKGNPAVSCYTCHRGSNQPMGVPPLPLPSPAPRNSAPSAGAAPRSTPQSSPTPSLPTADQILDKYVNAIGGQAVMDKLTSRVTKGTFTNVLGADMPYETLRVAPDKFYQVVTAPQGFNELGFNGSIGWEKNPRGIREIPAGRLAELRPSFQFAHDWNLKAQFSRLRAQGKEKISGRDVYVVAGSTADNKVERLFFDADTGLLLRRITYTRTMIGIIPEQVDFDDYREVQGIKVPFLVKTSSVNVGNPITTIKITEVKFNVPVDESKFNMPAATKPVNP